MTRYPSDYYKKVSAAKTGPLPKHIACLLCEYLGEYDKIVTKKDGTQVAEKNLVHEWHKRPQWCNSIDGSKTHIHKSKGCSNSVSHLKRLVSHGHYNHLVPEYESDLSSKQSFIGETFKPQLIFFNKESQITSWLELIVDEGLPLRTVKKSCREFRKSSNTLREIILMMVELFEKKIGHVMKEVERGSMLYDGWSKNRAHHVVLFSCFIKKTLDRKEKGKSILQMHYGTVFACFLAFGKDK